MQGWYRVNKERKKELKPYLDEFWQWACAVGPMLPVDDWRYIRRTKEALREGNCLSSAGGWLTNRYNGDEVQRVLTTDGHELRLPLLAMFVIRSDIRYATTQDDFKKVRAQFNRWANRVCGLTTKTKG